MAIEISLRGADRLINFLEKTNQQWNRKSMLIASVAAGMALMGAAIKQVEAGMEQAIQTNKMVKDLAGLTQSTDLARRQMMAIDAIASKGIFKRDDVYQSVRLLDLANVSLNKYLGLTERLGLRAGNMKQAAEFMRWFKGAPDNLMSSALFMRLERLGITAQQLKNYGLSAHTGSIVSKGRVEGALFSMTNNPAFMTEKMSSIEAAVARINFQWQRFQEMTAKPLLRPLEIGLNVLNAVVLAMRSINEATKGWVGVFAVGSTFLVGLALTFRLLKSIQIAQMLTTAFAIAQQVASALSLTNIKAILQPLLAARNAQAMLSVLSAAFAAAYGNFVPLAILAAAGIAVGGLIYGMDKMSNSYIDNQMKNMGNLDNTQKADRPIRHDDVENWWHRQQGRAWSG